MTGVKIEARWIPSAVNKFADSLSRTSDPGDARATDQLLRSIQTEYGLNQVAFLDKSLGETMVAKQVHRHANGGRLGEGKARL